MNKVCLIGRLTKDPEIRYTQTNNTLVACFTIAVNRRFAKETEEQTDFLNIKAWSKVGEFVSKHFTKGKQIGIVGRIQNRSWQDQDGKKKTATEIIAEEVYFVDSKSKGENSTNLENTDITDFLESQDLPF